jgi:threonine dehydratase
MSESYGCQRIASLVEDAFERIRDHVKMTQLLRDKSSRIWLKCEQQQHTGSFKLRGALSKLSLLTPGQSVVTASTGNHGLGVTKAGEIFDIRVKVFLPATANARKKEKLINAGVEVIEVQGDSLAAELAGKAYAMTHADIWVSPYNDPDVLAGQGTIARELLNQLPLIDRLYITVGGGGLISGIAGYMKAHSPDTEIIGCQPANSPEMYLSVQAGQVVNAPEELFTLSDGSAGPLEPDSITFPICKALIDRFILVTESEIEHAIRELYHKHQLTVEGAAGVAYAAALKDKERWPTENAVVVLCGGNIDPDVHANLLRNG